MERAVSIETEPDSSEFSGTNAVILPASLGTLESYDDLLHSARTAKGNS